MKKTVTSIIALSMVPLATSGLAQSDNQVQPGYITIVPPPSVPSLSSFRLETIRARDEDLLRALASAIKLNHPDLLEGTQILFTRIERHGTVFYRMDIQGVEDESTARELCQILEMNQCLVSRPGASVLAGDVQGVTVMPDGLVDIGAPSPSPSGSLEMVPLPTAGVETAPSVHDLERLSRLPSVRPDFVFPESDEEAALSASADVEEEVPPSKEEKLSGTVDTELGAEEEVNPSVDEVPSVQAESSLDDVLGRRPEANSPVPVLELTTDRPKVKTEAQNDAPDMQITLVDEGGQTSAMSPIVEDKDVAGLIKSTLQEDPLPILRPKTENVEPVSVQDVVEADTSASEEKSELSKIRPHLRPTQKVAEVSGGDVQETLLPMMRPGKPSLTSVVEGSGVDEVSEPERTAYGRPVIGPQKPDVASPNRNVEVSTASLDTPRESRGAQDAERVSASRSVERVNNGERLTRRPIAFVTPGSSVEEAFGPLPETLSRLPLMRPVLKTNASQEVFSVRSDLKASTILGAPAMESASDLAPSIDGLEIGAADAPVVGPADDASKAASKRFIPASQTMSEWAGLFEFGPSLRPNSEEFSEYMEDYNETRDGGWASLSSEKTLKADASFGNEVTSFPQADEVVSSSKADDVAVASQTPVESDLADLAEAEMVDTPSKDVVVSEVSEQEMLEPSPSDVASETLSDTASMPEGVSTVSVASDMARIADAEMVEEASKDVIASERSSEKMVEFSQSDIAPESELETVSISEGVHTASTASSNKAQAPAPFVAQASEDDIDVASKADANEEVLAQAGDSVDKASAPYLSESFEMPAIWVTGPELELAQAENDSDVSVPVQGDDVVVENRQAEIADSAQNEDLARTAQAEEAMGSPIEAITESFEAPAVFIPQMVTMTRSAPVPALAATFSPTQSVTLKAFDDTELVPSTPLSGASREGGLSLDVASISPNDIGEEIVALSKSNIPRVGFRPSLSSVVEAVDVAPVQTVETVSAVFEGKVAERIEDVEDEVVAFSPKDVYGGSTVLASFAPAVSADQVVLGHEPSVALERLIDAQTISGVEVLVLGEDSSPFGPMVRPVLSSENEDATLLAALVTDAPLLDESSLDVSEVGKIRPILRPASSFGFEESEPVQVAAADLPATMETVERVSHPNRTRLDILLGENVRPVDDFLSGMGVSHPLTKEEMETGIRVASLGPVEIEMSDGMSLEADLPSGIATFSVKKEDSTSLALDGFIEKIQNKQIAWGGPAVVDLAAWSGTSDESEILKGTDEVLPGTIVATVGAEGIEMRTSTRRVVVPNKAPHPMGRFAVVLDDTFALPFDLSGMGRLPLQKTPMIRPQVVDDVNVSSEPTVELLSAGPGLSELTQKDIKEWFPQRSDSQVAQEPKVEVASVAPVDANVDLRTALMASLEIVKDPTLPQSLPASKVPEVSRPELALASPDGRPKAMGPFVPEAVSEPEPHDLRVGGVPIDQVGVSKEDLMIRLSYATERGAIDQEVGKLRAALPPALTARGKFFGQKVPASAGLFVVGIQADSMSDREELISYFERNQIPYVLSNQSAASLLR